MVNKNGDKIKQKKNMKPTECLRNSFEELAFLIT